MKTKIKRHSSSALSILLTVCMLISCMTVGLIATDAAKVTDSGTVGAKAYSEVGATADDDSVGDLPSTLYFIPNTGWYNNGNVVMKANFNKDGGSNWNAVQMTLVDASLRLYYVTVPSSPEANMVQFLRGRTGEWSQWDYSKNLTIPTDGKNLLILDSGWSTIGGTWTTYDPSNTYTININSGANGTVSAPSLATKDLTVTLNVTPDSGYVLSSLSVKDAS